MRVIGLTGPKLSGKGTAAEHLITKTGATRYSMSGIIGDILDRLHLEHSRANLISAITALRGQFGDGVLATVLVEDIRSNNDSVVLIDGVRMTAEIDAFEQLPGFELWYIDAPAAVRYPRAASRNEKIGESSMTFDQFMTEESAPTEVQIRRLKKRAAVVMTNTKTISALQAAIDLQLATT